MYKYVDEILTGVTAPIHEKFVLVVLAQAIDQKGYCWLSRDTIADRAGCCAKTVTRTLKKLEEKRHITVERRYNKSNIYSIIWDQLKADNSLMGTLSPSNGDSQSFLRGLTVPLTSNRTNNITSNYISSSIEPENGASKTMGYPVDDINKISKLTRKKIGKLTIQQHWVSQLNIWREENEYKGDMHLSFHNIAFLKNSTKAYDQKNVFKAVKHVIWNWTEFALYCKKVSGYSVPIHIPEVKHFCANVQNALDFCNQTNDINIKPKKKVKKLTVKQTTIKTKSQIEIEELEKAGLI